MTIQYPDNQGLMEAARDFRYLLERGYPRVGALTFVGNRYQLPKAERDILGRGVYDRQTSRARKSKLKSPESLAGRALALDGHNVIITLESALAGRTLIECDDGPIRDTAGLSSAYKPSDASIKVVEMVLDYAAANKVGSVLFLLDAPMAHSGDLAAQIGAMMAGRGMIGRARAVPAPEYELFPFAGLTATSDSVIIDRTANPIDLAGFIIRESRPDLKIIRLDET